MPTTKKTKAKAKGYRSAAMASIHEAAEGLLRAGVIDTKTMKDFDEKCLTPVRPLSAVAIRKLRLPEQASQAV